MGARNSSRNTPPRLVGIDLGATNVRAGLVADGRVVEHAATTIVAGGSVSQVLDQIFGIVDRLDLTDVTSFGIGVPSVVDTKKGIVYEVQNIPSWKEVPLKAIMEARYDLPVFVNNDANCFALGEQRFGKGRGCSSVIGLILGTGFAGGIVIDGKLYEGVNCGAGEFGMIPYLDGIYEDYCSGQFFLKRYGRSGAQMYEDALAGDRQALAAFSEFGNHLGQAIKTVLFAYSPEVIVLGGSIRKAFSFFEADMRSALASFAYQSSLQQIRIEVSANDHIAILGAAALGLDAERASHVETWR
ncbi:ROK family protein [Rhodocaloribacter litoris]|uniref:ROK family protein n=1 Tax=Rhodocaloribacter litoris TaxID=2558931 RepID=UPI001420806A|nr:ROK family protein [Rhodocaloribacter litoris]QXD15372.1 ROK family protein [Rhodocaloribacter litoris]